MQDSSGYSIIKTEYASWFKISDTPSFPACGGSISGYSIFEENGSGDLIESPSGNDFAVWNGEDVLISRD